MMHNIGLPIHGYRRAGLSARSGLLVLLLVCLNAPVPSWALDPDALPTGGRIASGRGAITQTGTQMTVSQQSDKLIANWSTFNIGRDASVAFRQPGASSVALNRIFDRNPSQIFGSLTANGKIFLLNPSGIIFGQSARVDVGGLVASSLDLSDEDFLAGKYRFHSSLPGSGGIGAIINSGSIRTAEGGSVAFLSPHITNEGRITASGGTVALAAGNTIDLDFTGDGLLSFTVEQGAVDALAENKGLIKADGGMVYLSAKAADTLTQSVVNNSGIIEATGMSAQGGRILLDADGGRTTISGTLDASSENAQGGAVIATGEHVLVQSGACLNASGATGGGEVLVGGSWQGGDPSIRQATGTVVEAGATLEANATVSGNGGTVVAWSDITNPDSVTRAYGTFAAQGGAGGGDGGRIETSGHWLDTAGICADASAAKGKNGEWLLDPWNVIIGGSTSGTAYGTPFVPGADSTILATDIAASLQGGTDVTITTGTTGGSIGDITVSSAITKASGDTDVTLTLRAANSIVVDQAISNSGGTGKLHVTLDADNDSGTGNGAGIVLLNADIATGGGNLNFGTGRTATINSVATLVGGDVYVAGAGARTLATGGGAVNVQGEMIIANTNGLTINSNGGNIRFYGLLNSGNTYEGVTYTGAWSDALSDAQSGSGTSTGDTYLATITSRLENAVASRIVNYEQSWLGGRRVTGIGTNTLWRWVTGPEGAQDSNKGLAFFAQNTGGGGSSYNGGYSNWSSNEPNNYIGAPTNATGTDLSREYESVLQFTGTQGLWNDLTGGPSYYYNTPQELDYYVKETNAAASPLTINAGTGTVTFSGAVGTNKALAALNVTASGGIAVNGGAVTTEGVQTYNSDVTVGAAATTLTQTNTNTDFTLATGRSIATAYGAAATLTINTTRDIAINGTIGSSTNPLGLVFNADSDRSGDGAITVLTDIATAGGSIQFGGDATYTVGTVIGGAGTRSLTTSGGDVTFYGDVLMTTDTAIDTNGAADGSVVFNGKVDSGNTYALSGANTYSWSAAVDDADNVANSYLITITSALENSLARSTAAGNDVWLGAGRDGSNYWRWVTGPEATQDGTGLHFSTGAGSATPVAGTYSNWTSGEPNASGTAMQMWYNGGQAQWDDTTPATTKYYIRETGGTLRTLAVDAGDATVTFEGAVGSTSALKDLSVTAATTAIKGGAVTTDSGGAAGGQSYSGDITLDSASTILTMLDTPTNFTVASGTSITNASGADANLTIKTTAGIILDTNSSITSSSGKINTVFWSDADDNADGYISIASGSSITTNGGNIILGGGTDPASDYAVGNATQRAGVNLVGGLNAGGGDISVLGQGLSTGGAGIDGGAGTGNIQTSGSGTIAMTGIGYDLGAADGATGYGMWFSNRTISTVDGALNLTGTSHNAGGADNCWGIDLNTATVSSANGDITITGDSDNATFYGTSTFLSTVGTTGTGSVTQTSNTGKTWVGTLQTTGPGDVTIGAASTIERDAGAPATQVGGDLTIAASGTINDPGQITVTGTTQITAGAGNDITLSNTSNDFSGAVSVVSGADVAITDSNAMILGAVSATGVVSIATLTGDLTLTGTISTTNATTGAVTLIAGKNTAAGISTGGNIIITGNPTITTGAGGRATLYSGGVSGSTGLTDLIGSATGRFRYHSDESDTNYTTALGTGAYAVYREQPTVTITAIDVSRTYDALTYSGGGGVSFTGFVNGDTSSVLGGTLVYGGSSQGAANAGTYTITPGGYTNTLGYALGYADGSLTITPAALTVTANSDAKTYDGTPYSGGGGVSISGFVGGETSSVLSGTLSYGGTSQGASLPGVYTIRPAGLSAENYAITFVDGLLVITSPSITDAVVAGLVSTPTGTNGTGEVLENIGGEPMLPPLGPGSGSGTLAAYSAAALVTTPTPGAGGMILSSATLTAPVAFGRQNGAATLAIGGAPTGDLIEIGSVPVFSRTGAEPPRLEGAYVVGEGPSALSLTATAAGPVAAPEVSGLEGLQSLPFSLTLEGGVAIELSAVLTPQGVVVIAAPDSASALDMNQVVLMGLQTVRQELKTDLAHVRGVVVIQE